MQIFLNSCRCQNEEEEIPTVDPKVDHRVVSQIPPLMRDEDAESVGDFQDYEVKILEHKDTKDKVLWSKCFVKLYPRGQGPPLNLNIDMRYEITSGEAVFWINGKTTNVEAGHSFVVEANQSHFFHNYSNSVEFQFAFDYPDKLRMKGLR